MVSRSLHVLRQLTNAVPPIFSTLKPAGEFRDLMLDIMYLWLLPYVKGEKCFNAVIQCEWWLQKREWWFEEYVVKNIFRNMWSRIDTLDDDGGEELGRSTWFLIFWISHIWLSAWYIFVLENQVWRVWTEWDCCFYCNRKQLQRSRWVMSNLCRWLHGWCTKIKLVLTSTRLLWWAHLLWEPWRAKQSNVN